MSQYQSRLSAGEEQLFVPNFEKGRSEKNECPWGRKEFPSEKFA